MCAVKSINYSEKSTQKIDAIKQNDKASGINIYIDKYIESYPTNIKKEEMNLDKINNKSFDIKRINTSYENYKVIDPINEALEALFNTGLGKNSVAHFLGKMNITISPEDINEVIRSDKDSITIKTKYGDITINSDGSVIIGGLLMDTKTIGVDNIAVTPNGIVTTTLTGKWKYNENTGFEYNGFDGSNFKCNDLKNLLEQNGIMNEDPININYISVDSENRLFVTLDDGYYKFDSEGRIIYYSDGENTTVYNYNPTEEEKKELYDLYGMDPTAQVNFIATTTIRGHKIKYYSAGEQDDNSAAIAPTYYSKYYSQYPDELLSYLDKNFFGFVICPWELSSNPEISGRAGAYALNMYGRRFIFIPSTAEFNGAYYSINTPLHEMAHILQDLATEDNSFDTEKLESFYDEYKEEMPDMPWSCYSGKSGYDETPNINEFFADASVNYFQDPESLKRYMPELYEFMEDFYG